VRGETSGVFFVHSVKSKSGREFDPEQEVTAIAATMALQPEAAIPNFPIRRRHAAALILREI
jgi:hypothetical protein